MKYFKKIERGKIYLSPVNTEDYEVMTQWMNDPRATKGITIHSKITSRENDELLGTMGLYHLDQLNQIAELGILIWNAEEHGK